MRYIHAFLVNTFENNVVILAKVLIRASYVHRGNHVTREISYVSFLYNGAACNLS